MLISRGQLVHLTRDAHGVMEVIDDSTTRSLYFGTLARQSSMDLSNPVSLSLSYTRCMLAGLMFQAPPERILLIGVGGGSLVRFLCHHYPDARIQAVEYRASVVELARRFFELPHTPSLTISIDDGARFVAQAESAAYDLILVDAFDAAGIHPHVTGDEFFRHCRRLLAEGGGMAINLWSTDKRVCRANLMNMERAFGSRPLRLPVTARNNLIALGIPHLQQLPAKHRLRKAAVRLKQQLDLDYPLFQRQLWRHNTGPLQRLFG